MYQDEADDHFKLTLFESFPREIGLLKKWCETAEEYKEYVSSCNGIVDCYCSFLCQTIRANEKDFGDAIESGTILDKVFLDIDGKFGYEAMKIVHEYLEQKNIIHRVNASGRWKPSKIIAVSDPSNGKFDYKIVDEPASLGFHVYFWIVPSAKNPKSVLYNFQKNISEMISKSLETGYGLETIAPVYIWKDGKNHLVQEEELPMNQIYAPVDKKIWGDLVRISRITNTFNTKRKRYCVPLSHDIITNYTFDQICEYTKTQHFLSKKDMYMGQKLFKIPPEYDTRNVEFIMDRAPFHDENPDSAVLEGIELPSCIKLMMQDATLDSYHRLWLLIYLRDKGISMEEAIGILVGFLTPEKAHHCIYDETQPNRVFIGNQRSKTMKECARMVKICNCADLCPKCPRYGRGHPIFNR